MMGMASIAICRIIRVMMLHAVVTRGSNKADDNKAKYRYNLQAPNGLHVRIQYCPIAIREYFIG